MPPVLPAQSPESAVTPVRRAQAVRNRFNPIRGFNPQKAVRLLDAFYLGRYREVAWAMQRIEESDHTLAAVIPKRKKSVARLAWDIVEHEGAADKYGKNAVAAERAFLLDFYNNLTATDALRPQREGGMRLLIAQMMDAVGKGTAAHEIAWQPGRDGRLSAKLTQVPLWFFEATEGELRFLPEEGASLGEALEDKAWLLTMFDEPLMVASLVLYTYKHLSLKDWVAWSERAGNAILTAKTDAAPGSPEWDALVQALGSAAQTLNLVASRSSEFDVHDLKGSGELPYPALVELCDRAMSSLWRGSDLSTMSGEDKRGASLQQDETDILEQDDVDTISETLERQLTPTARAWKFGPDAPALCYLQVQAPDRRDDAADMALIKEAVSQGLQIPASYLHERFGLPEASDGENVLTLSAPRAEPASRAGGSAEEEPGADSLSTEAANAMPGLDPQLEQQLFAAFGDDFAPLADALEDLMASIEQADKPVHATDAVEDFLARLPELTRQVLTEEVSAPQALETALAEATALGATTTYQKMPEK